MAQDKEKKKSDHFASLVKHSRAEAHKSLVNTTDRRTFPQQQQAATTATAAAIFLDRAQTRDYGAYFMEKPLVEFAFVKRRAQNPKAKPKPQNGGKTSRKCTMARARATQKKTPTL